MSPINEISRAVENIRANTTIYTAIVEVVVNAIQAIEAKGKSDGLVQIKAGRSGQLETDGSLPSISHFEISDNRVGFTDENRDSFDTLYSDLKIQDGGKGFGRVTCLKYFDRFHVESDYLNDSNGYTYRSFRMGKGKDIIVDEVLSTSKKSESGTTVRLDWLRQGKSIDKRLDTIARALVEKLLPYFITAGYKCPDIILTESDGSDAVILNDFVNNQISSVIQEITVPLNHFDIGLGETKEHFTVRLFKFFFPKNVKSRISLVAHKREVSSTLLHTYVPEFIDDFYEKSAEETGGVGRNYILKGLRIGNLLGRACVPRTRSFDLDAGGDLLYGIGQTDIEKSAAQVAQEALGTDIISRQEKKKGRVVTYVDEDAPWHKTLLKNLDLTSLPYNPSNEEIELRLQKEKFRQEALLRKEVTQVLAGADLNDLKETVSRLVEAISESSKNDLVHYVALRRNVLDIFSRSLAVDSEGKYQTEGLVHDIIFPRKGDSDITSFEDHNLWIIDERLNFTTYVSSDIPLNGGTSERPDLAVYDKRVVFRGDNEPSIQSRYSNSRSLNETTL